MKDYIKNMVCNRCIMIVKQVLETLSLPYFNGQLPTCVKTGTTIIKLANRISSRKE